ncbi:MAG: response regulator, partial [Lachnospiraceae bacterium]|nr:response regulator [Lachnospiraceae bacterium]
MQRILVVDDAEMNRELLREILETDYVVEMAANGAQALQKLRECPDETAALLLDLHMPEMDGFAVIDSMRESGWMDDIPVLIISGENAVEVENKCFELGVADFIHKPFVDSIVKNRVRNTIELFNCKNQLEKKIERQSEALRRQEQIIKIQAEQLSTAEAFSKLMMEYRSVIME